MPAGVLTFTNGAPSCSAPAATAEVTWGPVQTIWPQRMAEDDEDALHSGRTHPAYHVQPVQNLGVTPEVHSRVGLLQWCPTPVWRAVWIIRWRPWKVISTNPQGAQAI